MNTNNKINNVSHKIWFVLFAVLAAGMLCRTAVATPIGGTVAFFGGGTVTGGSDLGTATGLAFNNPVDVIGATGDFSSLTGGTGTFTDFTFAPFASVTPLWTAGDFSFDLTSLKIGTQTTSLLKLSGGGVVKGTGFTDTNGSWTLTANGAGETSFSFSSNTVSEPGIALMLGIGLGGLGVSQWWRRRSGSKVGPSG